MEAPHPYLMFRNPVTAEETSSINEPFSALRSRSNIPNDMSKLNPFYDKLTLIQITHGFVPMVQLTNDPHQFTKCRCTQFNTYRYEMMDIILGIYNVSPRRIFVMHVLLFWWYIHIVTEHIPQQVSNSYAMKISVSNLLHIFVTILFSDLLWIWFIKKYPQCLHFFGFRISDVSLPRIYLTPDSGV